MYPHFIEVHQDDMDVSLNVDAIIFLANAKDCKYNCAVKIAGMNSAIGIDESYDELKKLIESSGALIQMGDPRLDTKHSLGMDELKNMIGEPVWNSNKMEWHIVQEIAKWDDHRGNVVVLQSTGNVHWYYDADDLIRFPLYRMKVQP